MKNRLVEVDSWEPAPQELRQRLGTTIQQIPTTGDPRPGFSMLRKLVWEEIRRNGLNERDELKADNDFLYSTTVEPAMFRGGMKFDELP